jgi:hypothetical protein
VRLLSSPARTSDGSSRLPRVDGQPRRAHACSVRIEATPEVVGYVRSRGGVLYVWAVTMEYGYHPVFVLEASLDAPGPMRDFQRFEGDGIVLLLDCGGRDLPESVHLDLSGVVRKRLRAAWNGNSFTPA